MKNYMFKVLIIYWMNKRISISSKYWNFNLNFASFIIFEDQYFVDLLKLIIETIWRWCKHFVIEDLFLSLLVFITIHGAYWCWWWTLWVGDMDSAKEQSKCFHDWSQEDWKSEGNDLSPWVSNDVHSSQQWSNAPDNFGG